IFFFSSRRRHTRSKRDWSSDVCSSDLVLPLAIVTIIVSPIAREIANTIETIIPDKAAGITTRKVVSNFVAPNASAPSRIAFGTAFIASSDIDAIIGIIITPMTSPGLKMFVCSRPGIISLKSGGTNVIAQHPYTSVAITASNSSNCLNTPFTLAEAYSLKYIADIKPIGVATSIAITVETTVPTTNGKIPNGASWLNGLSTVPVKKSHIGIRLKNSIVSDSSVKTIPIVIRMEVEAMTNKRIGINFSIFSETFLALLLLIIIFLTSSFVTLLFGLMCEYFLSFKSIKVDE